MGSGFMERRLWRRGKEKAPAADGLQALIREASCPSGPALPLEHFD